MSKTIERARYRWSLDSIWSSVCTVEKIWIIPSTEIRNRDNVTSEQIELLQADL